MNFLGRQKKVFRLLLKILVYMYDILVYLLYFNNYFKRFYYRIDFYALDFDFYVSILLLYQPNLLSYVRTSVILNLLPIVETPSLFPMIARTRQSKSFYILHLLSCCSNLYCSEDDRYLKACLLKLLVQIILNIFIGQLFQFIQINSNRFFKPISSIY